MRRTPISARSADIQAVADVADEALPAASRNCISFVHTVSSSDCSAASCARMSPECVVQRERSVKARVR